SGQAIAFLGAQDIGPGETVGDPPAAQHDDRLRRPAGQHPGGRHRDFDGAPEDRMIARIAMRTKPLTLKPPPDIAPLMAQLNDRQQAFCAAYATRSNATRAATLAGYRWPSKQGPRLTTFPAIKVVLEAQYEHQMDELNLELRREQEERARAWAAAWPPD